MANSTLTDQTGQLLLLPWVNRPARETIYITVQGWDTTDCRFITDIDAIPWAEIESRARYLAVLAYPYNAEARERFVDACMSFVVRGLVPQGKMRRPCPDRWKMKPHHVKSAVRAGLKLINNHRMLAARMAVWLISKDEGFSRAEVTDYQIEAQGDAVMVMYYNLSKEGKKVYPSNIKRDTWNASRPVVHLAVPFVRRFIWFPIGVDNNKAYFAFFESLYNGAWLNDTAREAERLRSNLPLYPRLEISPSETIQVLLKDPD